MESQSMAVFAELIVTLTLICSAGALIWLLLRVRERRRLVAEGYFVEQYSGAAKNPESLMDPDEKALEEMGDLLEQVRPGMGDEY